MESESRDSDAPESPGGHAGWAVRLIDAGIRTLERWRGRLLHRDENGDGDEDRGSHGQQEESPPSPSRLRRALILLLCLTAGGFGGMVFSYRLLEHMAQANAARVDFVQETLRQEKREAARQGKTLELCQNDNRNHHQAVREQQAVAEECAARVAALEEQLAAGPGRAAASRQGGTTGYSRAPTQPRTPQKTGNCSVGGGNLQGNLTDCIDSFNRP